MEGHGEGYINLVQQRGAHHHSRISLRHNINQLASSSHILFSCRVSFRGIGFTVFHPSFYRTRHQRSPPSRHGQMQRSVYSETLPEIQAVFFYAEEYKNDGRVKFVGPIEIRASDESCKNEWGLFVTDDCMAENRDVQTMH